MPTQGAYWESGTRFSAMPNAQHYNRLLMHEGENSQRFSQCLRATHSDALNDGDYPLIGTKPSRLNFPGAVPTVPVFIRYKL